MAAILVVEDEVALCDVLCADLAAEGHTVYRALDGLTALALADEHTPDLVILDWMLPGLDGLAVCRRLRQRHLMPILLLTARAAEADRVLGLEVGADDYVVKPFSMRELLARVRAHLRRIALDAHTLPPFGSSGSSRLGETDDTMPAPPDAIARGPLRVDPGAHAATLDGAPLDLTPKEFDLLLLFAAHPNRAFSRDFLVDRIWQGEFEGFDRAVDTHIRRLRRKLGPLGDAIVTVWGVGYRFEP